MKFLTRIFTISVALTVTACGGGGGGGSSNAAATPVAPPAPVTPPTVTASIPSGTFNAAQSVTLTSNAPIYFTTDSSTPSNVSTRYTGAIIITTDTVLSFIAIGSTGLRSSIGVETYLIDTVAPANHALVSATTVISANNEASFPVSIENAELGTNYRIVFNDSDTNTAELVRTGTIVNAPSTTLQLDFSGFSDGQVAGTLVLTDTAGNSSPPFTLALIKTGNLGPFNITGSVLISPGTQIDSDINDVTTTVIANNNFTDAQEIFAPGMLGGYVNQPNTGESGNLDVSGDEDFFFLQLANNDQIVLTIGDDSADLDIELYSSAQVLVDDSLGVGNTEVIEVNGPGDYYIRVFAFSGASNYVLSIGQVRTSAVTANNMSSFDKFVPNQAVFELDEKKSETQMRANLDQLKTRALILSDIALDRPQFMNFGSVEQRDGMINTINHQLNSKRVLNNITQKNKQETIWAIKALRNKTGVKNAQPNFLRRSSATPNDTLYNEQWHYPHIGLPDAWDVTTGNPNVIVAVIDSGILANHPDFQGKLVQGYDMISNINNAGDGDGVDSNPEDPGDRELGDGSSSFHGTHVAGTIAASTNNNSGVAGVAWQSRIMPIRVLGRDGGTSFDLIQGILYAAGLENASGQLPNQRADIINMSLGGGGFSSSEASAISAARDAGVIVIAAAGNSGNANSEYPASYDGVVSVAAVNQANSRASYSNFGANIDITAPGGDLDQDANQDGTPDGVLSTIGNDRGATTTYGYRYYQGTSMSAPHVAGVAALMKAIAPNLTPAEFDQVLSEGRISDDLGNQGRDDDFGYGLINAMKAVNTAQELASGSLAPLPTQLRITPPVIDFGFTQNQQSFNLSNSGGGTLTVSSVTENANWLTVTKDSNNASNLGSYTATVDRSVLTTGDQNTNITIQSDLGQSLLTVNVRVSATNFAANSGTLFAILGDPSTGDTLFQENLIAPVDGSYSLNFSSIPAGEYQLFIGSDMDNDNFICDAGEACGAYPTLNLTENLQVTENVEINIDISFDQSRFFNQLNPSSVDGVAYKKKKKTLRRLNN